MALSFLDDGGEITSTSSRICGLGREELLLLFSRVHHPGRYHLYAFFFGWLGIKTWNLETTVGNGSAVLILCLVTDNSEFFCRCTSQVVSSVCSLLSLD